MTMLTASESAPGKGRAGDPIHEDPPGADGIGPSQEHSMQEAAELSWLDRQLSELGAEILAEPIPDFLLRALSQLSHP